MVMEHHKNIEEYFGLKKEDLIIILKDQLIPILAKQIYRYMKVGMLKNEITAKRVTEEEGGGNRDSDEEKARRGIREHFREAPKGSP